MGSAKREHEESQSLLGAGERGLRATVEQRCAIAGHDLIERAYRHSP